jgi:uncharacterized protein YeaO (DUF488 family)
MIQIKRTYEPAARTDGRRVLVERLWPRGLTKEKLGADWVKDVAPSTRLRLWFGHRVDRWDEFQRRYRAELDGLPGVWQPLRAAGRRGTLTLLYSARDVDHNSAVVLRDYLSSVRAKGAARSRSRGAPSRR